MTDYEQKMIALSKAYQDRIARTEKEKIEIIEDHRRIAEESVDVAKLADNTAREHRAWIRRVEKTRHRAVIVEICALVMIGCALLSIAVSLTRL